MKMIRSWGSKPEININDKCRVCKKSWRRCKCNNQQPLP